MSDRRREGSLDGGTQLSCREVACRVVRTAAQSHAAWVPASPHLHTDELETFAAWLYLSMPQSPGLTCGSNRGTGIVELLCGLNEHLLKALTTGSASCRAGHKCLLLLLFLLFTVRPGTGAPLSTKRHHDTTRMTIFYALLPGPVAGQLPANVTSNISAELQYHVSN